MKLFLCCLFYCRLLSSELIVWYVTLSGFMLSFEATEAHVLSFADLFLALTYSLEFVIPSETGIFSVNIFVYNSI